MWEKSELEDLNATFEKMSDQAISSVEVWGGRQKAIPRIDRYIDLRYKGQASELLIPVPEGEIGQAQLAALADSFEEEHEKVYGHRLPGYALEAVNLRLMAMLPTKQVPSRTTVGEKADPAATPEGANAMRTAYWGKKYGFIDTPVLGLEQIGQSTREGPILVDCYDTTIVIPPDCTVAMGDWGNVAINSSGGEA
jgi:N-methylhydantoinase A